MINKSKLWAVEERKMVYEDDWDHYLYNVCKSRRRARIVKRKLSSKFPEKQFVITRFVFSDYTS